MSIHDDPTVRFRIRSLYDDPTVKANLPRTEDSEGDSDGDPTQKSSLPPAFEPPISEEEIILETFEIEADEELALGNKVTQAVDTHLILPALIDLLPDSAFREP